ncbi:2OG-Fe(II) oxygenase family protein [Phenylobacterium sp.]|jgi:predicted 2-oxoglutarate/Fe(II)-dependent dioxygenase YbiX|uniref:2OG-Fe(II) oxygenase family protein n=1 Tax=Phenylobacterium sp. TaxID=1871053 RepID=UPI002F429F7E
MALQFGEAAPWPDLDTPGNPRFAFSVAAGRFVLVGCVPDAESLALARAQIAAGRDRFDDMGLCAFLILRDEASIAAARDEVPGLRYARDRDGGVSRQFQFLEPDGAGSGWLLLDPTLRVIATAPLDAAEGLFRSLAALPAPDDHAGVTMHAPVLIVPRIFEPAVCRQLIALYDRVGGTVSGVMREVDGRTVGMVDDFKSRRDADIEDQALRRELRARIARRLLPEVEKALQFKATRMERYIVARYDAEEGGYFRPHRDNTTKGTVHRRFAVSINLDAEAFEGGDLRFPEFGRRTYRPPTGGAVVFSCSLLHEATPVTRGRRYAFLPFLYDEEGARVREANLRFIDDAVPPPAGVQA